MSNEIKGIGNSYTAEFWEYDPRVGRRWNIDPVNIGSTSGYLAFANNPIIFVDPFGLDTVRSSKDAKRIGDVFQHRNGNSNFYWNKTADGFEGGGSSESLSEVVVTARKKGSGSNYLNWPSSTRSDRMQWNIDQHNYRLGDFSRLTQQQIAKYQGWDKADQEWRQSSLFSLGVMSSPVLLYTLPAIGSVGFTQNLAGGAGDLINQKLIQGKSWNEVNFATTITSTIFGGGLVSSSIWGASGNFVNLSMETVLNGNGSVSSFNSAGLSAFIGDVGGNMFAGGTNKVLLPVFKTGVRVHGLNNARILVGIINTKLETYGNLIANEIEDKLK